MPKISIITPVYCDISQKVDWLDEMVESVISQTVRDWELILINDKSPISLDSVKMKYAADLRLRWFENADNSGPAKTRNTAIALAESDCILPLDSDDLLADSDVLEQMYDVWSMDNTKIIYGNLQMLTKSGANVFRRSRIVELGDYTFELAMNLNGLMPVTAMHSIKCHNAAGGWKDMLHTGLEDVEYWIAAGKAGFCGQKIDYTTLVYRRQENSRAYQLKFINKEFETMQRKIKDMHSDIYNGRFPMACCGKGGSTAAPGPAADPVVLSQQNQQVARISALEGYKEDSLEWVAYQGPKKGRFDILARGPDNLPGSYTILGTGHVFQIHKSHRKLFSDRQRLGFMMNQPDPRLETEIESAPKAQEAPQIIEVPKPELSTIVRPDAIAMQTKDVAVQERQTISTAVSALNLSSSLENVLVEKGYTVEQLTQTTPERLSELPGIGTIRANTIISKAKELIKTL